MDKKTFNEIYLKHRDWLVQDLKRICLESGKTTADLQIAIGFFINHLAYNMALFTPTQNGTNPETSRPEGPVSDILHQ